MELSRGRPRRGGKRGYEVTGRHVRADETIDIIALPGRGFVISIVVTGTEIFFPGLDGT